jgi:hypothetical protein
VLEDAPCKIAGDSDVEDSLGPVGENVNEEAFAHANYGLVSRAQRQHEA